MAIFQNLVELSRAYLQETITAQEFQDTVLTIDIFEPRMIDGDNTVYFDGTKNSWFEVHEELKPTKEQLRDLIKLQRKETNAKLS